MRLSEWQGELAKLHCTRVGEMLRLRWGLCALLGMFIDNARLSGTAPIGIILVCFSCEGETAGNAPSSMVLPTCSKAPQSVEEVLVVASRMRPS